MNSNSIKFRCPKCHKTISTSRESAGVDGICPACGAHVQVPKQSRLFGLNLLTVSLLTGTLILFAGGAAFVYRSHSAYLERKTRMRVSDAAMSKTGAASSPPARANQEQQTRPPAAADPTLQQTKTKPSAITPSPYLAVRQNYTYDDAIACVEKRIAGANGSDQAKELEKLLTHLKRIKNDGDLNKTDGGMQYGDKAMKYAASYGLTSTVKLLAASGAKVDWEDTTGATPLIYAAENGHKEVVELLLQMGARLDRNKRLIISGKTQPPQSALSLATAKQHMEIVELLRKAGAKDVRPPERTPYSGVNDRGKLALEGYVEGDNHVITFATNDKMDREWRRKNDLMIERELSSGAFVRILDGEGGTDSVKAVSGLPAEMRRYTANGSINADADVAYLGKTMYGWVAFIGLDRRGNVNLEGHLDGDLIHITYARNPKSNREWRWDGKKFVVSDLSTGTLLGTLDAYGNPVTPSATPLSPGL